MADVTVMGAEHRRSDPGMVWVRMSESDYEKLRPRDDTIVPTVVRSAIYTKLELDHAATHYVMFVIQPEGGAPLYACETGWGSYYGQWVAIGDDQIAWSYLTEKMPNLRDGDFEGWRRLFEEAGVEVFRA